MAKQAISKRTVDEAEPGPKPYFIWDAKLSGFGVKINPSGTKTYLYQYRIAHPGQAATTTPTRITIGKHGALTAEQARQRAQDLSVMVATGQDPRQERLDRAAAAEAAKAAAEAEALEADKLDFERIADLWLADYASTPIKKTGRRRRPSGVEQARIAMRAHLKPTFKGRRVSDITAADMEALLEAIPAHRQASRRTVAAYASIFWGWCERKRHVAENPMRRVDRPASVASRERVLTDDEMRAIWWATHDIGRPWGALYRLLLLTGQRRGEVAGMAWAELDRDARLWVLPSSRTKNGIPHQVPLSDAAVAELDALAGVKADAKRAIWPKAGLVMTTNKTVSVSGFAKAKRALDAAITKSRDGAAIEDWRPHDMRRTYATWLQKLGTRFEVIEACLNHQGGAKGGIAGVYQRHDWADEKRTAMQDWAAKLAAIVGKRPGGDVVKLTKRTGKRAAA